MTRVAMCPADPDEPLVLTMAFPHYEFACLRCGRLYGWLAPRPAAETPELLALVDARKAEWGALEEGLIAPRSWRTGCGPCEARQGYHRDHATAEQLAADEAARRRIAERVPRLAGMVLEVPA